MLVPVKKTDITTKDMYNAIRSLYPKETLSEEAVRVLIAHSAFETGWWKSCYNYNLGNIKCFDTANKDYYQMACTERMPDKSYYAIIFDDKNVALRPVELALSAEETTRDMEKYGEILVRFLPGSNQANFRAFTSLEEAIIKHVEFILQRTTLEVPGNTGHALVAEFCEELREANYFTANFDHYVTGVKGCYNMLESLFSMPVFSIVPGESGVDRLCKIAREFAKAGNKSWDWLEKGTDRSMSSCAITVRAIWWHAGCAGFGQYKAGLPISVSVLDPAKKLGAYVQFSHDLTKPPGKGDVFYVDNANRTNAHVGMFVSDVDINGVVETVEGGQAGVHVQLFKRQLHRGLNGKCYITAVESMPSSNTREIVGICYGSRMDVPTAKLTQEIKAAENAHTVVTVPAIPVPQETPVRLPTLEIPPPPPEDLPAKPPVIEQVPKPVNNGVLWTLVSIGIGLLAAAYYSMCY